MQRPWGRNELGKRGSGEAGRPGAQRPRGSYAREEGANGREGTAGLWAEETNYQLRSECREGQQRLDRGHLERKCTSFQEGGLGGGRGAGGFCWGTLLPTPHADWQLTENPDHFRTSSVRLVRKLET